jgi:hypothetical protein
MCLAARYACGLIAMIRCIPLAAFSAALAFAIVVQAEECLTVKAGIAREIGRLKSDGREKSYCVYARAGQTMKVTVKPLAPDMVTRGNVISPLISERQPTMCIRCRKGRGLSMFEGERDQHDLGHREERRPSREHQGIERAVALCQDIGRLQTRTLPRPRVGSGEHSQSGHRPTANTAIPTNAINTRWLSTKASWRAEPGRLLLP